MVYELYLKNCIKEKWKRKRKTHRNRECELPEVAMGVLEEMERSFSNGMYFHL